jgi:hypothetical protein
VLESWVPEVGIGVGAGVGAQIVGNMSGKWGHVRVRLDGRNYLIDRSRGDKRSLILPRTPIAPSH